MTKIATDFNKISAGETVVKPVAQTTKKDYDPTNMAEKLRTLIAVSF